jgi:Uma2 family endonuclease
MLEFCIVAISFRTYAQLALEDPEGRWEMASGATRRKPPESFLHGAVIDALVEQIVPQLRGSPFRLSVNHARLMIDPYQVCLPDLVVLPRALSARAVAERPRALETYHTGLPLVIEVWTPATAEYDVEAKIPEYRRAGTDEIWLVHPTARAVTVWVRRPAAGYQEIIRGGGVLTPARIPDLALDIDALFA